MVSDGVTMLSLPKTMAKFRPPKPNKLEVSEKVLFIEFEPLCETLGAFLSNFGPFYHKHSTNIVTSRCCNVSKIFIFPVPLFGVKAGNIFTSIFSPLPY